MMEVASMATERVAITVPPVFLKKLDSWAKKSGRSRSRFIVEEMKKRLEELEDGKITQLFNDVYGDTEALTRDKELAEEMLEGSAIDDTEDTW